METFNEEKFPWRIDIYLSPDSIKPDHNYVYDEINQAEAHQQAKIIQKRFLAHHVTIVPIIIAGRWYRKSEAEIATLIDSLTTTFYETTKA